MLKEFKLSLRMKRLKKKNVNENSFNKNERTKQVERLGLKVLCVFPTHWDLFG